MPGLQENHRFTVQKNIFSIFLLLLFFALAGLVSAQAPTQAGTKITNIAIASYQIDGQTYTAESNQVVTEVRAVYGISILLDGTQVTPIFQQTAPGTEAVLPFSLTNTGNAADSYSLSFLIGAESNLQYGAIAVYWDQNGNGFLDPGEQSIAETGTLAPSETISLLVMVDVRSFAAAGQYLLFSLIGQSKHDSSKIDDNNWRKLEVTTDAALAVSKSASTTQCSPGGTVRYVIKATNIGNHPTTPAAFTAIDLDGNPLDFEATSGLFVQDLIPSGLSVTGNPAVDFPVPRNSSVTVLYGYSNGSWSIDGNVIAWGGTASITAVGFFHEGSLSNGQTAEYVWIGHADPTLTQDTIENSAKVVWANSTGPQENWTNTAVVMVKKAPDVALGPRGDPLGIGAGSYKTPSLKTGPYTITYSADISSADFVPSSLSASYRLVFWNTVKNTGSTSDRYDIEYAWSSNEIPGAAVRFYQEDGITPLVFARGISRGTIGPLAPGESYTFLTEVIIPTGIPFDTVSHDVKLLAVSRTDAAIQSETIDRILFTDAVWVPFLKTSTPFPDVVPGATIHYTINFGNAGSFDAVNASLFDILPVQLQSPTNISNGTITGSIGGLPATISVASVFSPSDPAGTTGKIVWTFPNIPAGFIGTVSFDAILDAALPDGATIDNKASITAEGMPTAISNTVTNMAMRPNRLVVEKMADKAAVGISAIARYSVRIKNVSTTAPISSPVTIYDTLPAGFHYIASSSTLDGVSIGDPSPIAGTRTLVWTDIGGIPVSSQKVLSYAVTVGPTAKPGENFNAVYAKGVLMSGTVATSNTASARLVVYDSLNVDSQTIVGRVYFDLNDNRMVDEGETGVPGVRIYLENGTYTITDSQGKYHFEDIKAGSHVIKLDRSSLPKGISLLPTSRVSGLGDSDSILVNLQRGELYKANFRVAEKTPDIETIDLGEVKDGLPKETVTSEKNVCIALTYTVNPSETSLTENLIRVKLDKKSAGPINFTYLVVVPNFIGNTQPAAGKKFFDTPLDAIDLQSIFIDNKVPTAVFPFEGAIWIRLPEADSAFDTASYDKNSQNTNVPEFARGNEVTIHYLADKNLRLNHYVLGINPQNIVSIISEDPIECQKLKNPEEALKLAGIYRMIQPEASSAALPDIKKQSEAISFGFISPEESATYWVRDKITVMVRFPLDTKPELKINGVTVSESAIGRQIIYEAQKYIQNDYIGVPLTEGENMLEFSYYNEETGSVGFTRKVYLAGKVASVKVETSPKVLFADGKTEPDIILTPLDKAGIVMPEGSFVTLTLNSGRFVSQDANPQQDGFQARIKDGKAKVVISPEFTAGKRQLGIIAGNYTETFELEFMPYLRNWIVAGYGQGIATYSINKANQYGDVVGDPPGLSVDGRLAFFAKGTIFGCYVLTASFDSKPPVNDERLFQELQPDKNFPIYGDASIQKYDAETSDGKFLKIEKDRSYALYGDYTTDFRDTELVPYNRTFTGVKASFDNCLYDIKGFWTSTNQAVVKEEIRGEGTSGYYYLTRKGFVENSDKIRIETRSKDNPSLVLASQLLSRYTDYWINYADGSILFREPVRSNDSAGNPVFIVVVYEVKEGADKNSIFGVRPRLKLFSDGLIVGATGILEQGSLHNDLLYGADATVVFNKNVSAKAEAAWSSVYDQQTLAIRNGQAQTVSFKVDFGNDLKGTARYYFADSDFRNPSLSSFSGALQEYALLIQSKPGDRTDWQIDAVSKENLKTNDTVISAGIQGKIKLADAVRAILGLRYVDLAASSYNQKAMLGKIGAALDLTDTFTLTAFAEQVISGDHLPSNAYTSTPTLFDRMTSTSANGSPLGAGYLDTGVDASLSGYSDRVFVGAEYRILSGTKVLFGHEWMGYGATLLGRTVLGVTSQLFSNTYAFANYGMEDSVDVPRNVANFGIKNRIVFSDTVSADVGLESMYVFSGSANDTFVAPTLNFTYLSEITKNSLKLEARFGTTDIKYLAEISSMRKVEANLSYSLKDTFAYTTYYSGGNDFLNSFVSGVAFRPVTSDNLQLLGRLSLTDKLTKDAIRSIKLVNTVEANWQPVAALTVSPKYTIKWMYDNANGVSTSSFLDLYSIRVLYDVIKNVDFGFHFGIMPHWSDGTVDYYAGVETGYKLVENLYASAGWNYRGLADPDMVENSYHSIGFFIGLRMKFDETTFGLDR